ncbi:hypothetical protein [Arthrobacter sp. StoSoilB20]|uniref:hypothetical protein n=1 Tax=Arthrobacter sp. StoSoilB20 TaxID=2830995 RepID=UPI001CC7A14E|nr:hypothetical protein [Arthrobacter sp. StoSoilB20]
MSHVGLAIAVVTGILMFTAKAVCVAGFGAAPWRLGLLLLAGAKRPRAFTAASTVK